MCDCFNMACHGNTNALQLHIKVNSENLLPVPKKLNASSLRIPADPSWPKIPPRKLTSDASDITEQPYVVALTGKPRHCTLVQTTPQSAKPPQDFKYPHSHQRSTSSVHTLKKYPGYVDPRFKKITNTKEQAGWDDSLEEERDSLKKINRSALTIPVENLRSGEAGKTIPERDINTQQVTTQEAEKPDETRKIEDAGGRIDSSVERNSESHSTWKEKNATKNNKADASNTNQESDLKGERCVSGQTVKNQNNILEDTSCKNGTLGKEESANNSSSYHHVLNLTPTTANTKTEPAASPQETGPPLLFMLDRNAQSHSANVGTISAPADYLKQCYTVQVPVLTYQNIPVQISADGRVDMVERCLNNVKQCDTHQAGTNVTPNDSLSQSLINPIPNPAQDSGSKTPTTDARNEVIQEDESLVKRNSNVVKVESTLADQREEYCRDSHKNYSVNDSNTSEKLDINKRQESSDSEYYVSNSIKKNARNIRHSKLRKALCNTTGEDTSDPEIVLQKNAEKQNLDNVNRKSGVKKRKRIANNASNPLFLTKSCSRMDSILIRQKDESGKRTNRERVGEKWKQHNKSEQHLPHIKSELTGKCLRSSEPYLAFRHKGMRAKLSRKARTYFQKNSRSAIPDVDCNAKSLNTQGDKFKRGRRRISDQSEKITKEDQYSVVNLSEDAPNFTKENNNDMNERETEFHRRELNSNFESRLEMGETEQDCEHETSARTNTEIAVEKSANIPLKTQELLNKSYWDYYNKLRHKCEDADGAYQQCLHGLTASEMIKQKTNKMCEKDKSKLSPELRILEQCSALSTMINKALDPALLSDTAQTEQLYVNGNARSLSDPTANTQVAVQKNTALTAPEDSCDDRLFPLAYNSKARQRMSKRADTQFLELKTIVFFGSMMYMLIIFLPMLYDYLYYEEYSDYENLSYPELMLEYVLSSFKEAFGSLFGGLNRILFQPRGCKKCKGYA